MTKYIGPKTDGENVATQSDVGNSILSGSGAPSPGLGEDGDFYVDTATSDFYGPKASGSWGSPIPLGGSQSRAFATFIS